jgi:hypothetical protein
MPAVTLPTLLDDAYTRLTEVFGSMRVTVLDHRQALPSRGGEWITAEEIAGGGSGGGSALDRLIAVDHEQGLAAYGVPLRDDVAASFCLHRYAWPLSLLITLPWFLHRRVPRLPVDSVAVNRGEGHWMLRPEGFACLPGDPAAGLPEARVVPDEDALRAELRSAVAEHMGPVLDGFRPRMRRGPRTLWGMVTDEMSESLWYLAELLGEKERAVRELRELLPGGTAPMTGAAAFRELPGRSGDGGAPGTSCTTRTRISCCLYYTIDPQGACLTCPRVDDQERMARLAAG